MDNQAKILIIDDEKDILVIFKEMLELQGFHVQTANNGKHGIEVFKSHEFDLVITDIRMPEMDGLEVIKCLKELDRYLEIIVLTGYASVDIAIEALKAGRAFDFFSKPVDNYDVFFNTIRQAIEKRKLKIGNNLLLKEVIKHRDHLEEMVSLRTAELEQEISERKKAELELRKAKEKAETANLAKSQFIARISHELRTPMNAIIGLAHLTLETCLDDNQNEYVSSIQAAARKLLFIINEILDFSELENHKTIIENQDFKLSHVLDNILEPYKIQAKEKGIDMNLTIDKSIPEILIGDKIKLQRILTNLTDNALKFTSKGKIIIKAELIKKNSENKVELIFSIIDTGIGIKEEKICEIFEPFTQADGSLSRSYGGTGLGLCICRQMTEMIGGRLWVDSLEGHGSNFMFTAKFGYLP
ncbi:Two component system response regulator/histidine kinase [Desulfonema limicola]|uniref:Sensory/regulatory protein RpfC n=1 Tax=Desulfonema limicola TaxID=45656 RepID=A0A975BAT6_9BACT|nr:response regulator [Desulfonema limicola]QTA81834.1 Two component system response regulator/histidine kinase [Desulfonema limicola]